MTVYDWIERWVNEVEDLAVGTGMPVLLLDWHTLKVGDAFNKICVIIV